MTTNKHYAAGSSVAAAVFLTGMKLVVGLWTGSLGILSEAAHSGLDLVAAVITLFAVRISDKPADQRRHFGYGKIESFSALVETLLLLITCIWIIYEAIKKFLGHEIAIIGSEWGILVMVTSIVIDFSRARILRKAAREHHSQALEADALHFSSDVLSSSVVIAGLVFVWAGKYFNLPVLNYADPIAALGVSIVVIRISLKLGKETIDVLLDTAPRGVREKVIDGIMEVDEVLEISDVRVRPSGPTKFIEINVGLDRNESHKTNFKIVSEIRKRIHEKIPGSDIVISTYPVESKSATDNMIYQTVKRIIDKFPDCTNTHNIRVYDVGEKFNIALHVELKRNISLEDSHELSHRIIQMIQAELPTIDDVSIDFECADQKTQVEDITCSSPEVIEKIESLVPKLSENLNCHEIKLFRQGNVLFAFVHCITLENYTVDKLSELSQRIIQVLKSNINDLENVHIHFEPKGAD